MLLVASAHALPAELSGTADEVRVQFPWGSLLDAVLAADEPTVRGIVELLRPGADLAILLSVTERDRVDGLPRLDDGSVERVATGLARSGGLLVVERRAVSAGEIAGTHSTWAKRLGAGRSRPAWVVRLRRVGQAVDEQTDDGGRVGGVDPHRRHTQLADPHAQHELAGLVVPGDAQVLVDAPTVGHEDPARERPSGLRHEPHSARLSP